MTVIPLQKHEMLRYKPPGQFDFMFFCDHNYAVVTIGATVPAVKSA